MVYGEHGATQFVNHDGCSARKRDLRCLGRRGYGPCNMAGGAALHTPSPEPLRGVQWLW
jgi:hypothetical protein